MRFIARASEMSVPRPQPLRATGTTSITFTPPGNGSASDIAILDGQAAISFRTYYAGSTVIEATSPGLASATVTITSQGEPAWVEGSSPKVESRPYKP